MEEVPWYGNPPREEFIQLYRANQEKRPFTDTEYEKRLQAVMASMETAKIDVLFVSKMENMFYLTNYQTAGNPLQFLILRRQTQDLYFFTRLLEETNVFSFTNIPPEKSFSFQDHENPYEALLRLLEQLFSAVTIKKVGLEMDSDRLSCKTLRVLEPFFQSRGMEIEDCSKLIGHLRLVKSEEELELMRHSAIFTSAALKAAMIATQPGLTENDVAARAQQIMFKMGSEYGAYPVFVSHGPRSARGHSTQHRTLLKEGVVTIEPGGCYCRYVQN